MSGELFEDIVGQVARRWPPSYDTCIGQDCPRCGAKPMDLCRNPVAPRSRKGSAIPCLVRIALGEGWAKPVSA